MQSLNQARTWLGALLLCALAFGMPRADADDIIELLNGAKLEGKVIAIHRDTREVEFESNIAGQMLALKYDYKKIHRVVWNDKEYIVTPKAESLNIDPSGSTKRTESEVNALIDSVGSSNPDWLASTPVEHPPKLNLNWPLPAPQPWNNQKNIGQYIWDRINPNAKKWRSGVRLMYHLLTLHSQDKELSTRIKRSIGGMYFRFFQDYPRAAWWWQQAGPGSEIHDQIGLAECYFKMGNADMAKYVLNRAGTSLGKIKLLGTMGETDAALRQADTFARVARQPHEAWLLAGDICRSTDQFERAIAYYQKVIDGPEARNKDYMRRYVGRAKDSIDSIKRFELLDISKLKDGVYRGDSLGYEAPIHIAATVEKGRITQLEVTQHREKQYYSAIRDVPHQIVRKQNLKEVDATSRATITAVAIINATAKALTSPPQP